MRFASFFAGAGGLDLGLTQAGWECVFANEADPAACETLRANRPGLRLSQGDVRGLRASDIETGDRAGGFAVVGGPPCQAFSTAGRRLGLSDERGNVFLHFLDLAAALEPDIVVIENVRGLLSAPLIHRPHAERGFGFPPLRQEELRGGALRHIVGRLREHGYLVSFDLYDTSQFGVPQRRERLILVAAKKGAPPHLAPTTPRRPATFREAVAGLRHHEHVALRARQAEFLDQIGPGQNWRALPETLRRRALGRAYESSGGRTGFLRRLAWDEPAPTLLTDPTMAATLLGHPVEMRPLSVQEYARLQTFPDDYAFTGTLRDRYRLIGNAVPVAFARAVGEQLAEWWTTGATPDPLGGPKSRYRRTSDATWTPAAATPRP